MDEYYQASGAETRRGRPFLRAILLLAIGFVAGLIAMGYALTHWETAARFLKTGSPGPQPTEVAALPAPARIVMAPVPAPAQAAMDRRVAALEGRINRIDARATAAVGNADRAEGLLVAFAARRALDRGVPLGYIETLLRDRFADGQPQAVATIINASRDPVRLDQLQSGLDALAPSLLAHAPDEGWWQAMRRELADIVVLRRAGTPSPAPEDRLARARNQLQAGHVDAALAEVARMPGRANAAQWITLARRYVAARGALDMIETEALLSPHPATPAPLTEPTPAPAAPHRDKGAPAADAPKAAVSPPRRSA